MLGGTEKLSLKGPNGAAYSAEAGAVRFSVEELFKGEFTDKTTIDVASMASSSCGPYGLIRGERYLVYAYASQQDPNQLHTGVCTRTIKLDSSYAKEDLDFLRSLPPPGVGGNIRGNLWVDTRSAGRATPLPNVKVNIRGEDKRVVSAFTDEKGGFEVKFLKPGKYRVEPELPAHYTTEHEFEEVLVEDRGTAGVGFEAYINGRVSGRVVDKDGRGYNWALLEMAGSGKTVYGHSTGEDGAFEVEGAPPGEYLLYIQTQRAGEEDSGNFYYPGTFKREEAEPVKLGLGEKVEGLEFALPDEFKVRTIEGQVTWEDGRPAGEVNVLLICPRSARPGGFVIEDSEVRAGTDKEGRFRIEAFTGEVYWLEARGGSIVGEKGEYVAMHSRPRRLSVSEDLKGIKLVLSEKGDSGGCPK